MQGEDDADREGKMRHPSSRDAKRGKKNLTLTNLTTWRQVGKGNRVELESGKRRGNVMMERTRERVLKKIRT